MALRFYTVPDLLEHAVGADQEGAADDTHERPAHELFRSPGTVRFDRFVGGIAQQRKIQFLLGLEIRERLFQVGACAEDQQATFVELLLCVTKLGRFDRSTGSVGLREEKEDDAFAAKIRKRNFTFVAIHYEIWRWLI